MEKINKTDRDIQAISQGRNATVAETPWDFLEMSECQKIDDRKFNLAAKQSSEKKHA